MTIKVTRKHLHRANDILEEFVYMYSSYNEIQSFYFRIIILLGTIRTWFLSLLSSKAITTHMQVYIRLYILKCNYYSYQNHQYCSPGIKVK